MDKIFIRDLRIETIVGLYDWERVAKQTLLVNIELATDIRLAASDGDLQHTIDYSAVCAAVTKLIQDEEFELLESLAESAAGLILKNFSVDWLRFSVSKMDVLNNVSSVGVEIERDITSVADQ